MEKDKTTHWTACKECNSLGKIRRKLSKKLKRHYQIALDKFEQNHDAQIIPIRPKGELYPCVNCNGTGLVKVHSLPIIDKKKYPHIGIIGGGIGGTALAIACLHRGIPFTLFERDRCFNTRSQGYGLTLQQASKAMKGLGVNSLKKGIVSTKHIVHTTDGKIIGEWGMRKWIKTGIKPFNKPSNIHISRQSLRSTLIEQLGTKNVIQWGHKFINYKECKDKTIELNFEVNGERKINTVDLLIGADGIRSMVREQLIGENKTPLQYLGCIVILGICSLDKLQNIDTSLLDGATVFQTVNGNERLYIMPFTKDSVMWQFSYPISEMEAIKLSKKGAHTLKKEACSRAQWHNPIPQILSATEENKITGYPVYDRELLHSKLLEKAGQVTLIGDAAHPMSPFKGQGANQAILDALSLARKIYSKCNTSFNWKKNGLRDNVLTDFETEMISRTTPKVKASAEAAQFLHSNMVLQKTNEPRRKKM